MAKRYLKNQIALSVLRPRFLHRKKKIKTKNMKAVIYLFMFLCERCFSGVNTLT